MPETLEWPPPVAPVQQCSTQWAKLLTFTAPESAVLTQNNLSSLKRIEGMLNTITEAPPFPYQFTWPGGGYATNTPGGFRLGMLAIGVARHWDLARTYKYGTRDMVRCTRTALRCFAEACAQPWPDQETLHLTRPPMLHPLVGSYLGLALEHCILLEEPVQAPMMARIANELSTPSPSALVCRQAPPYALLRVPAVHRPPGASDGAGRADLPRRRAGSSSRRRTGRRRGSGSWRCWRRPSRWSRRLRCRTSRRSRTRPRTSA